jgi:hypothetical protein
MTVFRTTLNCLKSENICFQSDKFLIIKHKGDYMKELTEYKTGRISLYTHIQAIILLLAIILLSVNMPLTSKPILYDLPYFSVSPSQLLFGNVNLNTTKTDSVTVTNTGTADLVITNVISLSPYFTVSPINGTITPGSSSKYYITFVPPPHGLQNGKIYFHHNAGNGVDSINISGTGVSPIFTVNTLSLNFGNVNNGTTKKDSVTITNTGEVNLNISNITGSNPLFTIAPLTGSIAPGSSQKFYVTFAPVALGLQNGIIYFHHNAVSSVDSIIVNGTGVSLMFSVSPTYLYFGYVNTDSTKTDSVTVTNVGGANLIISSLTSSNPLFTAYPAGGTILPGSSMKFYISFAPNVNGYQSGYIYFHHNSMNLIDSLGVTGAGITLFPRFTLSSNNVNFGNVATGTSKIDSVTVTNDGNANLIISGITGTNTFFTISPNSANISPGLTRIFYITFTPLNNVLQNGYLIFHHNAGNGLDTINVKGNGVSPQFTINTNNLMFGNVQTGSAKTDSVNITNTGTVDLIISSITSTNTLFTMAPTSLTIIPGATVIFSITFAPLSNGFQEGKFYFHHNAKNGLDSISVSGNGVSSKILFDPLSLNFGNVNTGNSKMDSVTVTNNGTTDLIISQITAGNIYFAITTNSAIIASGSSQKFYIVFSPLLSGLQQGYIYFIYNNTNARDSIFVSGTGVGSNVHPLFSVNHTSIDFGKVNNGSTKRDSVIITNTGNANLIISNIKSGNTYFNINPEFGMIPAGSTQKFYITFSPLTAGQQVGYIYFSHNAVNKEDSIYVTGSGIGADLSSKFSVSRSNIDFGSVPIGSNEKDSVLVTNAGLSDLIISNINSSDGHYLITPVNGTIAPGKSLEIFITFVPTTTDQVNAKIYFTHNAGKDTISVTGKGLSNIPVISILAARQLLIGTEFAIEGIITRALGSYTRIQDQTAAITIFQTSGAFYNDVANSEIQMADKIHIQGRISEINFLKVINGSDLTGYQRLSRSNQLPIPAKVTLSELATNGEQYESSLITVENLSIISGGDHTYQAEKTYQISDPSDNSNNVSLYIGNSSNSEIPGLPIADKSVTFVGILNQLSLTGPNGGYQLLPILSNDLYVPTIVQDESATGTNSLSANYPNPFYSSTTIQYNLENAGNVTLKVFNILGKEVATIVDGYQEAGNHSITFSATDNSMMLDSGVYFYSLSAGAFVITRQMIFLK